MNEFKILKVSDLRAKLATIPARLLLSILILLGILTREMREAGWSAAGAERGEWIRSMLDHLQKNPMHALYLLLVIYGLVSYLYFFMRMFHSWLIGLVAGAGVAFLVYELLSAYATEYLPYLLWFPVFGGVLIDVVRVMRYAHLKAQVLSAAEDRAEYAFGDGYDRGFDRGYQQAIRETGSGRHRRIEQYDDYEEEDAFDGEIPEREPSRGELPEIRFFRDCDSASSIKRRYRELCKVYHPDSGNGSTELFEAINREYEELIAEYE